MDRRCSLWRIGSSRGSRRGKRDLVFDLSQGVLLV